MGALRELISEVMSMVPYEDEERRRVPAKWTVTPAGIAAMGFAGRLVRGTSAHEGYTTKGIWAPYQALKDMDAEKLSQDMGRPVPEGVTANDMLEVLKKMQPVTTESGVTLVPAPNLQRDVAYHVARVAYHRYIDKDVDLVVTPQSSSRFAETLGTMLAQLLGAKLINAGLVKSLSRTTLDLPDHVTSTKAGKDAARALERWKNKLKAGEIPSLRSTFQPSMRQHLKNFMELDPRMAEFVGEGKRVLLVDDVVTTGSTVLDGERELKEMGFEVVGKVAAVKEQESPSRRAVKK